MSDTPVIEFIMTAMLAWGPPSSGKTLWGITCPFKPILFIDTEKGSVPYRRRYADGVTYVDVNDYDSLVAAVRRVQTHDYTTVVIDSATWVADWAGEDVKAKEWKNRDTVKQSQLFRADIAKRCAGMSRFIKQHASLLVLTAFARGKFQDNAVAEPKINHGFLDSTDLALALTRLPEHHFPNAEVAPPRRMMQLPARIPNCTWAELLRLLAQEPAGWDRLSAATTVPADVQRSIQLRRED